MTSINKTKPKSASKEQVEHGHVNHMGGVSYDINNPIKQLRIMASSCFFGEPKYYSESGDKIPFMRNHRESFVSESSKEYLKEVLTSVINIPDYRNFPTNNVIERAIDAALEFNAEETLKEAVRLRNEDHIRTTPQIIMVRAANNANVRGSGLIAKYAPQIMLRTDEAAVQMAYHTQVYAKPIPNALKKAWKKFLESCSELQLAKYRMESRLVKTVDVVNMVHAYSDGIDKLMKGTLKLDTEDTWEALISKEGSNTETWTKAVGVMGHMALLRNISNFITHNVDEDLYLSKLIKTAENGKQLPFRYYTAYKKVEGVASKAVLAAIEECLRISLKELPKFPGKVMSLCDNSGSAQCTTTSSMGTVKISDIANLTAILTGHSSEDGYIGIFGDRLHIEQVDKRESVLKQAKDADAIGKGIGGGTEHGIWLFLDKAIKDKQHWDHIFVYSDMQAGHGGLFGDPSKYPDFIWDGSGRYIDVAKMISTYRKKVNPDVKVYLVQVAGYADTLIPEFYDKTYILGGWGDGILRFADYMGKI